MSFYIIINNTFGIQHVCVCVCVCVPLKMEKAAKPPVGLGPIQEEFWSTSRNTQPAILI